MPIQGLGIISSICRVRKLSFIFNLPDFSNLPFSLTSSLS